MLLAATAAGYSASFFNAPVELPALGGELAAATCGTDRCPQLLFRLGVASHPLPPDRRRALDAVLRED